MAETDKVNALKLDPAVHGTRDHRFGGTVHHYRGIPYATISERFAKPSLARDWRQPGQKFREYGAICPQPAFSFEESMGLPTSAERAAPPVENEFACCNLNVTCPMTANSTRCPVYLWIHGGGQSVSFPSAQHRLGDPGVLVAQSVEMGKPIILVTVNYRMNVFGFGDPEGINMNLDLQDLATAVSWVEEYIDLFGGDPENITIGGQSAGAIYTHGLLAMNVRPKRVILASGSLYLTPPQDRERCSKLLQFIERSLRSKVPQEHVPSEPNHGRFLHEAPVQDIVKILEESKSYSWWMFDAPMSDWKDDVKVFSNVEAVLLSDCKEEGAVYDVRLRQTTKERLLSAFQSLPASECTALFNAYGFDAAQDDYEKCVTMARLFVNDSRYALWTREIWSRVNSIKRKAYLCYYDEVNPFRPWPTLGYPVAHHAVDLLAAFGGYDDEVNEATKEAGRLLRGKWINFINGEEPWAPDAIYCIGPEGQNDLVPAAHELDLDETLTRRRYAALQILKHIGLDSLTKVWQQLLPTEGVDQLCECSSCRSQHPRTRL